MSVGTPKTSIVSGFGYTPIGDISVPRLSWHIPEILPRSVLAFLAAPAKAGKSTLALHLCLALSSGGLFLGQFPTRKAKVLYFCLEDHLGEVKARAKHLLAGKRFPKNFLLSNASVIDLANPATLEAIEADIKMSKADVVVIDTFRRAHHVEENSSTEISPILGFLRRITRELSVTTLVVHHSKRDKNSDKDDPGSYLRGTSDLDGSWETLIGLSRAKTATNARVFHRYRSTIDFQYKTKLGLTKDPSINDYPIVGLVYESPKEDQIKREDEARTAKELTIGASSANTLEETTGLSRDRLDGALDRMAAKGLVRRSGTGRNTKWELAQDSSDSPSGRKQESAALCGPNETGREKTKNDHSSQLDKQTNPDANSIHRRV